MLVRPEYGRRSEAELQCFTYGSDKAFERVGGYVRPGSVLGVADPVGGQKSAVLMTLCMQHSCEITLFLQDSVTQVTDQHRRTISRPLPGTHEV